MEEATKCTPCPDADTPGAQGTFLKTLLPLWGPSWKKARGRGLGVPPATSGAMGSTLGDSCRCMQVTRVRPPGLRRRASVQTRPPRQWPMQSRTRAPCVHQEAMPSPAHKGGTGASLDLSLQNRGTLTGCSEVVGPRGPGGYQFREHGDPPGGRATSIS